MSSLLNTQRPPAFCPGCSHERVVHALDKSLQSLKLQGKDVAIVTDIGCSGLFDTFFNTHALHGLHGRALTYATGLKLVQPDLNVIAIMGDGGLGIGGAHVLSSCRRNLDISLLVLNNFNYGMTGGQCSATTPQTSNTSSGFLNELEASLDICKVAVAAGCPWVHRLMATDRKLVPTISEAILFHGFSIIDIWGICPGRYSRKNKSPIKKLKQELEGLPKTSGFIAANSRQEFGSQYRSKASQMKKATQKAVIQYFNSPLTGKRELLFLGAAGQRINTAGELISLAALSGGLCATQKNDYPITVLRGHSISEVVISSEPVGYTGSTMPDIVIALSAEGVNRREYIFRDLTEKSLIICATGIALPENNGTIHQIDFDKLVPASSDWALAALIYLAQIDKVITPDMLNAALHYRYTGEQYDEVQTIVARCVHSFKIVAENWTRSKQDK